MAKDGLQIGLGIFQNGRQAFDDVSHSLRQYDAVFAQEPLNLISLSSAHLDKILPSSVQRQHCLLLHILDRNEPHVGPAYCFTDGLGIGRVIPIRLDVRLHKLRCH